MRTIAGVGATGRWVRYGDDAATALRDEIRQAKDGDPLRPVTVVVPSNQVGVSVRRQLASHRLAPVCGAGPGLIAVSFLTPYRLAELLGASSLAAAGRRPVSTPVLTAGVRAALTAEPGHFAAVATHPATEAALVAAYRELREASPRSLEALAATGRRAGEVVRLHQATRARVEPDWYDEQDLMAAAARVVADGGGLGGAATVLIHLPQRLTPHAAALLRTVGDAAPVVVLAGCTGDDRADSEVIRSIQLLGVDLGDGPESLSLPEAVSPGRTQVITTSDADEEVRAAVRAVVEAVHGRTPLDRIAVLHAAADPYGRLLREHLSAAGLQVNGTADVPLTARLAGRTLLGLLDLPASGFRRQDVFAWLTGAPVVHGGSSAPTAAWERLSRAAGVVGRRGDWDELLRHHADRLEAAASDRDQDEDQAPWKSERDRAEARRALALRAFVLELVDGLERAASEPRSWSWWSRWATGLLSTLLGGEVRRSRWPDVERRAIERVEISLERLAALDRIEGPVPLAVFARTLIVELEADLGRIGRFGEGVLVGPVSMGVGVDLDLVVFVGMAEGTFPATVRDDSLLPDLDRQAASGDLDLRSALVDRLHHQFLAVTGSAQAQLLCLPRGDLRRSTERVPSRWVLDVACALAAAPRWHPSILDGAPSWWTDVASFDDGLRSQARPTTAQEHRLLRLMAADVDRPALQVLATSMDGVLGDAVTTVDARHSPGLTRFDGNLTGLDIPSPVDRGTSATRLELWAKCPHAYLQRDLLRVEPLDQPEDELRITPLQRGNLVHEAMETFIKEVLTRPTNEQPDPSDAWTERDHDRLDEIATERFADYEARGLTGRPIFWRRDQHRIRDELHRVLFHDDTHRRRTGTRPVAAELAFGFRGGADPVPFPLGDGRVVPIRGKADRVDEAADGTLHVVDYKTGSATPYGDLSAEDPHHAGTHLQLAVYALAARLAQRSDASVDASYWFISTKGKFKRLGYVVDDDVLARVGEAMHTIVTGIEAGVFSPYPKPPTTSPFPDCQYCDPDDLGTTELLRHWNRKKDDSALAAYLDLIAPLEPAEDEVAAP